MRPSIILRVFLSLLTSVAFAGSITQFQTSLNALTDQAVDLDGAVWALTNQTSAQTAKQIPPRLEHLIGSINAAIADTTGTAASNDPTVQSDTVEAFGLFSNTVEELMDDFTGQKPYLIGVFGLGAGMHERFQNFDTAYQNLGTTTKGTMGDAIGGDKVGYYVGDATHNTTLTICIALAAYPS